VAVLPCISLFAGSGALERGVAQAVAPDAVRPVLYVEREAFAAAYLGEAIRRGRLDDAPVYSDVTRIPGRVLESLRKMARRYACVLTAGFNCQPWSAAGKGLGAADARWLWPHIARIVRQVRPAIVFLENVPPLVSRGGLGIILGDLAEAGYDAAWGCFAAAEAGASHKRQRVFVLADRNNGYGWPETEVRARRDAPATDGVSMADGYDSLGWPEAEKFSHRQHTTRYGNSPMADDRGNGRNQGAEVLCGRESELGDCEQAVGPRRTLPAFAPGPDDRDAWAEVLRAGRWDLLPALPAELAAESPVPILADGLAGASRVDLLRLGGNGVVAECAAIAFRELWGELNPPQENSKNAKES